MDSKENEAMYWGIDVSKDWVDIAIGKQVSRVEQRVELLDAFIQTHQKGEVIAVLESTGGYEYRVGRSLEAAGIRVHRAHPSRVAAFATARGRLAKTDKIDARLLSEYGRFIEKADIKGLPSGEQETLRSLSSRLSQLKILHHQESCRLGTARDLQVQASHRALLEVLKAQISAVSEQLKTQILHNPALKIRYDLVCSMPGIGPTIGLSLVCDLPELGQANKKEIAALVGVAPITRESGQRTGHARISYGRCDVRRRLYMGALTACRYNATMRAVYERLLAKGKAKKVAIVAVMRKMLVILNAMVQSNTAFRT